ncbi:MAG: isocitrate/isopropylmalate family dehydrogenase [Candidatus Levybacteria bacterium]|nr:isocitrate/isopropylmalate family dehydrogenase [Candidatus Levybacteria bacterium]
MTNEGEPRQKTIALVKGDASAPKMMSVACEVVQEAAKKDNLNIKFEDAPMGWNAYPDFGDTLPKESLKRAIEIGIVFFGGVGDFEHDDTIGKEKPEMKPEARVLLQLRKQMGLLLNFRPMIYHKSLAHLAKVKPEEIPDNGVEQVFIRFLLEDSYFGTQDLAEQIDEKTRERLGIKLKKDVTGDEELITELAYYRKETVEKYIRAAFSYARAKNLPLISIDKANVMARYDYWRKITTRIGKEEFPDVSLTHQLIDSANSLLFTPQKLNGVIACGNEHGDILSDGAAAALGSMGLMHSSAINPDTQAAMFESGAGTAPGIAEPNPIGRTLAGAMMLRHIDASNSADSIERATKKVLQDGWRTLDLASPADNPKKILGTAQMGEKIIFYMESR